MSLRILLFISALCLVLGSYPRKVIRNLTVDNGGPWGEWHEPSFCAAGSFAVGYDIKMEPLSMGDESSLNSVLLYCESLYAEFGGKVQSGEGPWGTWYGLERCNNLYQIDRYIYRFQLKVEKEQGNGDDSAANDIQFYCHEFWNLEMMAFRLAKGNGVGAWGDYGSWSEPCPPNSAVCGIQAKIEAPQGGSDDSALNDVKLFCCELDG